VVAAVAVLGMVGDKGGCENAMATDDPEGDALAAAVAIGIGSPPTGCSICAGAPTLPINRLLSI
jgi:hypothetical protein